MATTGVPQPEVAEAPSGPDRPHGHHGLCTGTGREEVRVCAYHEQPVPGDDILDLP